MINNQLPLIYILILLPEFPNELKELDEPPPWIT
jgi:hypothetical protein